jgi:glucose/arabinose dehydrogenase
VTRLLAVLALVLVVPAQAQTAKTASGYALSDEKCGPYPKLRITLRAGFCAGLVASKADGLIFPRTLVQVPDTRFLLVADMGGWTAKKGRVLLLDPDAAEGKRLKVLLSGLDLPHGLAVGSDKRIYVGAVDKIFRFDPLAADPAATVETIVQGLPGLTPVLPDGTRIAHNFHPLKNFVFDRIGRLFVNIGAPSDACDAQQPCRPGEGDAAMAALWMFAPPDGGIFPALKPGDPNPPHTIYARGLRNSMALAVHPNFPDTGYAFLQGENGRDLPDADKPNEEINALTPGKHYGWPYCYDVATVSAEYAAFLKKPGPYRDLCANAALYAPPLSVMPPHGAPLGMLYYGGDKFSGLKGKLIVALHGYRPTGNRILIYDTDEHGFPKIAPPPVRYNVSCGTPQVFAAGGKPIAAAPYAELVSGWHKVNGVRPQGAPVGLAVASDGAIWVAEDKNQTIIRIDADDRPSDTLPCNARTVAQIAALANATMKNAEQRKRVDAVRTELVEKHCTSCHAGFGLKPGMTGEQKDTAVLRFLLAQDGWIYPGDPDAGALHTRVWGLGAEQVMPADGRELIAKDASYKALLQTLDELVRRMGK